MGPEATTAGARAVPELNRGRVSVLPQIRPRTRRTKTKRNAPRIEIIDPPRQSTKLDLSARTFAAYCTVSVNNPWRAMDFVPW